MEHKKIKLLHHLLSEIEQHIPFKDTTNTIVSQVTVGWQLDHALKVTNAVCRVLIKTNPNKYKKEFNFTRMLLFPLCYIPRGKAKAPKIVLPPDFISTEDLFQQLKTARAQIENVKPLPKTSHFIHHIFGMLSKEQTLRFLEIHTKHHLKIVRDILKK
ncbi:DUF1569 domain-containing protein [Algibacter sp. 2305UL17-15]|uniref:DUF1569 domain-containing protein n=1 Tax=Algibacter sp. 2305UL17-15 TaxID=3231268 RepID=UPI0034581D8C